MLSRNSLLISGAFVTGLFLAHVTVLHAQSGAEFQPADAEHVANKPSLEIDEILRRWEAATTKLKTPSGQFSETICVGGHDETANGRFYVESDNHWRIELISTSQTKFTNSKTSQQWIRTSDTFYWLDNLKQVYSKEPIPKDLAETEQIHTPLPLLFFMEPREAVQGSHLSFLNETDDTITISVIFDGPYVIYGRYKFQSMRAYPLFQNYRNNFEIAIVTLSKKNFLPNKLVLFNLKHYSHGYRKATYHFDKVFGGGQSRVFRDEMLEDHDLTTSRPGF